MVACLFSVLTFTFFLQQQGKTNAFSLSGVRTKLFGGDTPEQREQKLKQLDVQISEAETQVKASTKEAQ